MKKNVFWSHLDLLNLRVDCFTEEVRWFQQGTTWSVPTSDLRITHPAKTPGVFSSTPQENWCGRGVVNLLVRPTVRGFQFQSHGICSSKSKAFGTLGQEGLKDGTSTEEAKAQEEDTTDK